MSDIIEWKETESRVGPNTHYGYWNAAKVFSIYQAIAAKGSTMTKVQYCIKSMLPGFRPDLPMQPSVEEGKVFAQRMLERWVAKRGLLFKDRIVVTDAMKRAAHEAMFDAHGFIEPATPEKLGRAIEAALKAREPHAASNTVQKRDAKKR